MTPQAYLATQPTRAEVDAWADLVVLDFGTNWCGHCQAARPWVDAALQPRADLHHVRIEDGPGRPLGRSFGVTLWPTLVFLRHGHELARVVRPRTAAPLAMALVQVDGAV